MHEKPILLVDFDGVIHSYESGWKGADKVVDGPVPGAIKFLRRALSRFQVAIYSARSGQEGGVEAMRAAIDRWDDEYFTGNDIPRAVLSSLLDFPTEKPPAFLTLDDRCVQFTGTFPDVDDLVNFKPWNKKGV